MDETFKKLVAASIGAVLTSFVTTPLEVVKTRLQVQAPTVLLDSSHAVEKCKQRNVFHEPTDSMLPKQRLITQYKRHMPSCRKPNTSSTLSTFVGIVRREGPLALYAGLSSTLLTAVPSTAVYFTSYEMLLKKSKRHFPEQKRGLLAMASGSMARVVAATIFSPLELIRVQMQAFPNAHPFSTYVRQVWQGGTRQVFAGLGATLARDIPFSALYWYGIETSQEFMTERIPVTNSTWKRVGGALISGVLAGVLATVVTHPFDVVKTRAQLVLYSKDMAPAPSFTQLLREVWIAEGARVLTVGLTPRVIKVVPACAIMISSYEAMKLAFNVNED